MTGRSGIATPKRITISVVRRSLLAPAPGTAAPLHAYAVVFTTKGEVKSAGSSLWGQVEISGKKPTHTWTIRYTSIPFDIRDRLRDARGDLYQILEIDNIDLKNREYRIRAALVGSEDKAAAT